MRTLLAILALSAIAQAQTPQLRDVPESANHEVARRGNNVEETGLFRQAGQVAEAMATPTDDSQKWYLTLVGKKGEAGFEKMRKVLQAEEMRPWVNPLEPNRSVMHCITRMTDEPDTKNWIAGAQPAIDKHGLPVIIIQPPRSGRFGAHQTIVKCFHGEHSAQDLADKVQDGIKTYLETIRREPIQVGISQKAETYGVAPPFDRERPPAPPQREGLPAFDWPPPKVLTIDQIRAACPGATAEFVIGVVEKQETNLELVKLRWENWQIKHPDPPPKAEPIVQPVPAPPEPTVVHQPDPAPVIVNEESEDSHPFKPTHSPRWDWVPMLAVMGFVLSVLWMVQNHRAQRGVLNGIKQIAERLDADTSTSESPSSTKTESSEGPKWKPPTSNASG